MNAPLRRGAVIRHHNHLCVVEDLREHHSGQQRTTIHVKLKDLNTGHHVERSLEELQPIQEVDCARRSLQYSYARGSERVFMDTETFDEHVLDDERLHGFAPFLAEGQEVRAMFVDGALTSVETPEHVSLHVASTAVPERSVGGAGNVFKDAELENGLRIKVPLFIKTGDLIRVDVRDRTYAGKEKEAHA